MVRTLKEGIMHIELLLYAKDNF